MRVLHIHAQGAHHDDAFIVGTRGGLLALREAIDLALTVRTGASEVSVGDGEGYCVLAMLIDADEHGFPADNASVPYTADYAMENQDNAVYPWTRIGPKEYDALIQGATKRHADWKALDRLSDHRAADDSDSLPLTAKDFSTIEQVPRIRIIRMNLGMTQEAFAEVFGLSLATVRDWEQGRSCPDQSFLRMIESIPYQVCRPSAADLAERDTYNQLPQDIPPDVRRRMADTIDNMYEPDGDGGGVANG